MNRGKEKYKPAPDPHKADYRRHAIFLVTILIITFIVYLPCLDNNFVNWDDPDYIYQNPVIQKLNKENIKTMCFDFQVGHYHPLTMFSLAIDYSIGKLNPKTYHTTNLVLHLCNTALVFVFIFLLFEKTEPAAITSVLFGVSTMHVESVAWAADRKTVLYTLFFLVSLIFYLRYLKEKKNKFYAFTLLFFILSILSKEIAAPLAVTLIAIDWLKGRKLKDRKVIMEKIPFFAIALFSAMLGAFAQYGTGAGGGYHKYDLFSRLIFAGYGFCQYLYKLIIPIDLSAYYPYPDKGIIPVEYWISFTIALLIAAAAFYSAKKDKRYLFCFLFFTLNFLVVSQILPSARVIMADRYSYLPSLGLFFALGIALDIKVRKVFVYAFLLAYIFSIGILTFNRCKVWHDSFSLWEDVIEKYPGKVEESYNNRGIALAEQKKYKQANADFTLSISINPKLSKPFANRGITRTILNDYKGAKDDFDKLVELNPEFPDAYYLRGNVFMEMDDMVSAVKDYSKVLSIVPNHIKALNNRGFARRALKNYKEAIEDFDEAIKIHPGYAEAYVNRALLKYDLGDVAGAEQDNQMASKIDPSSAIPYLKSGDAKSFKKDFAGAIADYDRVLQKHPDNTEALFKRGTIKIKLNDFTGAIEDFTRLIALMPDNYEAYYQRGIAKNKLKDYKGAIGDFNQVLELKPDHADGLFNRGLARQELQETVRNDE
jgi:protein O-mannosyl-transferase